MTQRCPADACVPNLMTIQMHTYILWQFLQIFKTEEEAQKNEESQGMAGVICFEFDMQSSLMCKCLYRKFGFVLDHGATNKLCLYVPFS